MKKVLFATTALVATAGVAAADVALSGMGEIGVVGGDVYGNNTQFWTDIDVTFSMTGTADNGLTFGATVDLDENGAFAGTTQGGETLFIASGPWKLTMGDTDGAFDAAMQEVGIGGSIDDSNTAHVGFSGNSGFDGTYDGQIATFQYTFDSFTGYLSAEVDDSGAGDAVWGIGGVFNADLAGLTLRVGLGYQTADDNGSVTLFDGTDDLGVAVSVGISDFSEVWGISVGTTFNNGLQAVLNYSNFGGSDTEGDVTHSAIGLGYSMNALTIGLNYGQWDGDQGSIDGYGLAVNYDLGGGLSAQFGYGKNDADISGVASNQNDSFSLGLSMSF